MVAWLLTLISFAIIPIIWIHGLSARIGNELARRKIDYDFDAGTYWQWCFLGSLILVGPIVFIHKLCKAMNLLCEDYNKQGC